MINTDLDVLAEKVARVVSLLEEKEAESKMLRTRLDELESYSELLCQKMQEAQHRLDALASAIPARFSVDDQAENAESNVADGPQVALQQDLQGGEKMSPEPVRPPEPIQEARVQMFQNEAKEIRPPYQEGVEAGSTVSGSSLELFGEIKS